MRIGLIANARLLPCYPDLCISWESRPHSNEKAMCGCGCMLILKQSHQQSSYLSPPAYVRRSHGQQPNWPATKIHSSLSSRLCLQVPWPASEVDCNQTIGQYIHLPLTPCLYSQVPGPASQLGRT